ncbi:MAG: hypothetical protein NTX97_14295 [Bacteroidetes bacterium]|nr:hypothetical protein [Bacteroidota bacterium]
MNKIYKLLLPFGLILILLTSSCELYNPAEPVPSYIHIEKIGLTTDYSTQGTNSSNISDAWVYVDEQLIGCFELPVTFPVLSEGSHTVKIRPGIKVNGIASNRAPYPFYSAYEQVVDFQVGKIITLSPTVTYLPSTNFALMQDFETVGVTISPTINSDTTLQEIASPNPNVFEGTKSGIAYVDASRIFFECATVAKYTLPKGGSPVFLEFNYKCNYEFTVSVIAYGTTASSQFTSLHINPSEEWKKAYIYLTPNISGTYSAVNYKMVWGMLNSTGVDSAAMVLDNIKLVY